jgi:predicted proteasome-type protease
MTCCVGIRLDAELVFLSDSRTNAGLDQIGAKTMHLLYLDAECHGAIGRTCRAGGKIV